MLKNFQFSIRPCFKKRINIIFSLFYHKDPTDSSEKDYGNKSKINTQKNMQNYRNGFQTVFREWEDTELGSRFRRDYKKFKGCPFIIMSYNILCQSILQHHMNLYHNVNPTFLQWNHRLNRIIDELQNTRPQILCMQEVECSHYDMIRSRLENLDYKSVYFKRTGDKVDGCAIFFSKAIFQIENKRNIVLYDENEPLLKRDNIAILLRLSLKSNPGKSFIVVNTHLLYNPKREDIRLAQLQQIFKQIRQFKKQTSAPRNCPVIFVGDFNFSSTSSLFEFITDGAILWDGPITQSLRHEMSEAKKLLTENHQTPTSIADQFRKMNTDNRLTVTHNINLASVLTRDQLQFRGTTYHREWIPVDHIFYSAKPETNLKLLSTCLPPLVDSCFPIPNGTHGSDHHYVAANFLLT